MQLVAGFEGVITLPAVYAACVSITTVVLACIVFNPLQRWRYRRLPGRIGRPLVGDLPEIAAASHEFWRKGCKTYGPIYKSWWGPRAIIILSDPDTCRKVLIKSSVRPLWLLLNPLMIGQDRVRQLQGLLMRNGGAWSLTRRAWQPAFHSDSLAGYAPLMVGSAAQLMSRLEVLAGRASAVDIFRELGNLTMHVVGTTAYGVDFNTIPKPEAEAGDAAAVARVTTSPGDRGGQLVAACMAFFRQFQLENTSAYSMAAIVLPQLRWGIAALANLLPDVQFRNTLSATRTLDSVSLGLLADWRQQQSPVGAEAANTKRSAPGVAPGSFLGLMLAGKDTVTGHSLSDSMVVSQANTFLLAGYETTANAMSYCIYCLATNPEAEEKLVQELRSLGRDPTPEDLGQLPYLCAVVDEALRLYPPAPGVGRELTEDCSLLGFKLHKGDTIYCDYYAMQRDPQLWPRAEEFLPERWLPGHEQLAEHRSKAYMPFGAGARMCIGYKFALMEARLTLAMLYRQFMFQLAPWQQDKPLQLVNGLTLAPKEGIWVTPVLRHS